MNFLKKTFAAAMIGATLATPAIALADHDSTPFTQDEQKTLQIISDFGRCRGEKLHAIPGQEINQAVTKFIQDNGGTVTQKSVSEFVQQRFIEPAEAECFDELNIDVNQLGKKVDDLIRTHGPEVGTRTKLPTPGF